MGFVIMCQNYIRPRWDEFTPIQHKPSKMARFLNRIGLPDRYLAESAEINRLNGIDPAQEDINAWVKRWRLPADSFKGRPKKVGLPSTKQRVSEVYTDRDTCSLLFDRKFEAREAVKDDYYGSQWLSRETPNGSWLDVVATIYNEFWIEEVDG